MPSQRAARIDQFLGGTKHPTEHKTVRPRAIRRGDVRRVDVDQEHFELLQEIAGLAKAFLPEIERAGAPVMKAALWERLRSDLEVLSERFGGSGAATADLLDMLHDLR